MNRVILVGRITKDPELKNRNDGSPFVQFSIAVNRTYQNRQGQRETDFINCVVFNKQAENLAKYIRKGALIGVEGRLTTNSYTDQNGNARTSTDVLCDNISFLSNAQQNNNNSAYDDLRYSDNYNQTPEYNNQNYQNQYYQNQQPYQNSYNPNQQPYQNNQYNQNNQNSYNPNQQPYNPNAYKNTYQQEVNNTYQQDMNNQYQRNDVNDFDDNNDNDDNLDGVMDDELPF